MLQAARRGRVRPSSGRCRIARMIESGPALVLYVRDGCHLCDQFLIELSLELGGDLGGLRVVNVDTDPGLAARYGLRVPVLEWAGEVAGEGQFDRDRFWRHFPV